MQTQQQPNPINCKVNIMLNLLVIDDDEHMLSALQRMLRYTAHEMDMSMRFMSDPKLAIQQLGKEDFDIILSDYQMPGMDGIDLLRIAKEMQPQAVRMMLSASDDFHTIKSAVNEAEVFRYIAKPWDIQDLINTLKAAAKRSEQNHNEHTQQSAPTNTTAITDPIKQHELEQQQELQRLEQIEPGITKVVWDETGAVVLDAG
jgi:two-component system, probable response regulator PhcQ